MLTLLIVGIWISLILSSPAERFLVRMFIFSAPILAILAEVQNALDRKRNVKLMSGLLIGMRMVVGFHWIMIAVVLPRALVSALRSSGFS